MDQIFVGDVAVARVEEMHGPVGMTPEQFFPGWGGADWDRADDLLVPDHLDPTDNIVQVAMQTWALRSAGRTILIDTGIGNDKTRPAVPSWDHLNLGYLANLAAAGIAPEDVDVVVNTHLHVDHIGWNTRLDGDAWVPTFPNATYVMSRADFEYWNPANNSDIAGGVNENAFEDSIVPVLANGQVQLWEDGYVIDENLRIEPAPGHTVGSSVVVLESGAERALFAADLLHTPLQLQHPDHSSCFCEDPALAGATRRRLFGWAADHHALVLPAHLSGHSAFELSRSADAFRLEKWAPLPRY